MKERPILFSGAMVRALLDGSKPQSPARTECVTTYHHPGPRPHFYANGIGGKDPQSPEQRILDWPIPCPYGEPGDRLYVRETFVKIIGQSGRWIETDYQATYCHGDRLGDSLDIRKKWTPSIHMPRDASRILLEITSVRVERLNDISEADAQADGIERNWIGDPTIGPNGCGGQAWFPIAPGVSPSQSISAKPSFPPTIPGFIPEFSLL